VNEYDKTLKAKLEELERAVDDLKKVIMDHVIKFYSAVYKLVSKEKP